MLRHIVERTVALEERAAASDLDGVRADLARIEAAVQMLALLTEDTLRLLANPSTSPSAGPAGSARLTPTETVEQDRQLAVERATVLVVDNSVLNRDMLARRLERWATPSFRRG